MFRLILISVAALAVACGNSDSTESAGDAVLRQLDFASKGQYGRMWEELHPAHQALVSRDRFDECANEIEVPDLRIVEVYDEPIDVYAIPEKTSKAVTFSYKSGDGRSTETLHQVMVDGAWRWVFSTEAARAYEAGDCP